MHEHSFLKGPLPFRLMEHSQRGDASCPIGRACGTSTPDFRQCGAVEGRVLWREADQVQIPVPWEGQVA